MKVWTESVSSVDVQAFTFDFTIHEQFLQSVVIDFTLFIIFIIMLLFFVNLNL